MSRNLFVIGMLLSVFIFVSCGGESGEDREIKKAAEEMLYSFAQVNSIDYKILSSEITHVSPTDARVDITLAKKVGDAFGDYWHETNIDLEKIDDEWIAKPLNEIYMPFEIEFLDVAREGFDLPCSNPSNARAETAVCVRVTYNGKRPQFEVSNWYLGFGSGGSSSRAINYPKELNFSPGTSIDFGTHVTWGTVHGTEFPTFDMSMNVDQDTSQQIFWVNAPLYGSGY